MKYNNIAFFIVHNYKMIAHVTTTQVKKQNAAKVLVLSEGCDANGVIKVRGGFCHM